MQFIADFFNSFWMYLKAAFVWVLHAQGYILGEVAKCLFSGLLVVVSGTINALDVGTILTKISSAWGLLDPRIAWFMVNLGISQGLGILGLAFGIRFLLNLIPAAFTRV
jgi:hypothetical protein